MGNAMFPWFQLCGPCSWSSAVVSSAACSLEDASRLSPPWGLPVIGASYIVARYENPWEAFSALSRLYGSVFQLCLGSRTCLVVSSPDALRQVLLGKTANDFVDRPDFLRYHAIFRGDRNLSLALCDWSSKHRRRRELTHSWLHPRAGSDSRARLGRCVRQELSALLEHFDATHGQAVNVRAALRLSAANVFFDFICSKRFSQDDKTFLEVVRLYDAVFQELFQGFALDFMPWLKFVHSKKLNHLRQQAVCISRLTTEIVDERIQKGCNKDEDLVDLLLLSMDDGAPDSLDRQEVEVVLDDLLGGHSVVANLWLWALYILASYGEEAQKKLAEEARQSLEKDVADEDQQLPYAEATLYEILRMVNSPIIPHICSKDTTLQGYCISKGTMVMFNTHDLNFSTDLWEDPWSFRPERFLSKGMLRKPAHFVPFGTGRRACLGDGLVRAILVPGMAALCQRFQIGLGPGQPPADLKQQRTRVIFDRDPLLTFVPCIS
uniref:Cytochrome P450 n=1 Tax=Ornithodoros moubata TaxID=6938 RepID=A0A0G4CT31_ORNMO|nr:cytochrome P450 [Ornithodoros moubata]